MGTGRDLRRGPQRAIADLKTGNDDGTILVHGGPNLAKSLTRLGLVDEYQDEHLKLDVVEEQRFRSGALAQILVPRR